MNENSDSTRDAGDSPQTEPSRPSLNERLMNQVSSRPAATVSPPQPTGTPPASRDAGQLERDSLRRAVRSELRTSAFAKSETSAPITAALKEARRFVRVRYFSFLFLLLVVGLTLVVAVIVLANSLLSDNRWEEQVASAGVAAGALLVLVLMQYRPATSYSTSAVELTQLEALRVHLERTYELWEDFLDDRGGSRELSANELATAVASMTSTTRDMVALQASFVAPRRQERGAEQPARPQFPSPTMPDPRRY